MSAAIDNPEADRYRKMWRVPEYRTHSPGQEQTLQFLSLAHPKPNDTVIDFGCGSGKAGYTLATVAHLRVLMLDFAENCLDEYVREMCEAEPERLRFKVADLTQPIYDTAAFGFCCDVMEHIPPADVLRTLTNILTAADRVFFGICTEEELHGPAFLGEQLHLTVEPAIWWERKLEEAGATIHWTQKKDENVYFYCSSWKEAAQTKIEGHVNVSLDTMEQQIRTNVEAGWQHLHPFEQQDREILLLAGGPSLNASLDEIRRMREAGAALVTTNGTYNWAIEHGLKPSMQVIVDARPFNARFVKPVQDQCVYMVASQVHPSVLEGLPHERTYLWHGGLTDELVEYVTQRVGWCFPVVGGSTVILRAIPLLRILGYWRIHIFGFDSCADIQAVKHHAYEQPENDDEWYFAVSVGGETFRCAPWMISQASEFRDLVKMLGDHVELAVHGNGLIATMLKADAEMALEADQPSAQLSEDAALGASSIS